MDEDSALILKRYFKEYYFRYSDRIRQPFQIESREFGYIPFNGGMIRHLSYKEIRVLRALLVKEAPAGVYCSNSCYHDPSAEMQKKGWMRADLIFDIDADLLKLPCKKEHDVWLCKTCGKKEFGLRPEVCPTCKHNKILEFSWVCQRCLDGTKNETFRLIEFLEKDFGISNSQMRVFFSGNAGYHVEVTNTSLDVLDQHGRAEISDYLAAQGAEYAIYKSPKLSPNDPGWRGRVARYVRDLPPNTPPFHSQEYSARLSEMMSGLKPQQVDQLLDLAIRSSAIKMDAMVTTDIHRIFRMPETLNQKTGLVKRECEDLSSFDPKIGAIALENETDCVDVLVDICPKVELGGGSFGPYRNEKRKLPLYVAVYLIAKGAAKVVSPTKIHAS